MSMLAKVMVICMVAVMLMSCAGRRARQAERAQQREYQRELQTQQLRQQQPAGPGCTAPASGGCSECSIQCLVGQSAVCRPGESQGNACVTEASCRCGPAQ